MRRTAFATLALVSAAAAFGACAAEPIESPAGYDLVRELSETSTPAISTHDTLLDCLEAAFVESRKIVADTGARVTVHCVPKRFATPEKIMHPKESAPRSNSSRRKFLGPYFGGKERSPKAAEFVQI